MATFTIDSENNIAALAEVPDASENVQTFASEKELSKLAAPSLDSRLVEMWDSPAAIELKSSTILVSASIFK